jgi:phosphate transport system permease protein
MQYGEQAVTADSVAEFRAVLEETPGAFGLMRRGEVRRNEMDVLEVVHTTHSLNLRPSFFVEAPSRAGEVGGISTIILNTLVMVVFVLLIATPIGLAAAVYLVEYAKQGRFLTMLRVGTDTLAGVPSIIFGLFGMVFFSQFLGLQTGLLAGTFTLTLMILPTVVRTSEEALKAVPDALREGSLALGGTKLQTIARVVIPSAAPGILTGVILGIGRSIGETAALLFTMGSNLAVVRSLNSPIRVLSVHLYLLIRENISIPNAFATATILVIIVLLVNFATRRLISRMNRLGVA